MTATGFLWRVVEREVAFEPFAVGFHEIDAVLVRPAAVAALSVPLDALDRPRIERVAGIPDTRGVVVLTEQHLADVREDIESQRAKLWLERRELQERPHLLVRREPVLRADRGTFDLEIVEPHARDAERIEVAEPVAHPGQLVGRRVVAVKGDNQAWREALSHQPFDRGMRFRRGLPRELDGAGPAHVVEIVGSVHRDADGYRIFLEERNVPIVDERAVGLDAVGAESFQAECPELLEHMLRHEQRLAAENREMRAGPLQGSLHPGQVVGIRDVAGIPLRILVAVLTLDVALDPERPDLDTHDDFSRMFIVRLGPGRGR